jgi:hypothetical protein
MSSVCKAIIATVFIIVTVPALSIAQFTKSKYEIGISAGTLVYQGDLSANLKGDYKTLKPSIGLHVTRTLDRYFAVRAGLLLGKLITDEANYKTPDWKRHRNFKFSTPVTELSSTVIFNFLGENNSDNFHRVSPYVFAGAGATFLNIKRDWSNVDTTVFNSKSAVMVGLGTDTTHSLPGIIPVLPVGAGLRFIIGPQLSLNAEATYRFTANDYLDGFKYSGNPKRNDSYYGFSVGINYRFGGYNCPKVK